MSRHTVLVVEDEEGLGLLLSDKLRKAGFEVTRAASAEEAEALLLKGPLPALMLLDHSLPGKSGLQMIEEMSGAGRPLPPFIVTTGRGDERLAVTLMKLGAWDYLVKDSSFLDRVLPSAMKAIEASSTAEALRLSEERFRTVFDRSNVAKSLTLATGEMRPNPALCELLGYSAEELSKKSWRDLTPPEDIAKIEEVLKPLLAGTSDNARFEKRYIRKDGSTIWANVSTVLQRDAEGRPDYFITAIVDITRSRNYEAALKASEERFKSLFEQAPLGYQSLDEEGRFIDVNQAWLETLGYSREEVTGRWFGDFLAPEYRDAFLKRFPVFKAKGAIHSEFEMLHKNGSRRFIAFEGRIGRTPEGAFKQTHCILRDITQVRQLQADYANLFEAMINGFAVHELILDPAGEPSDYRFLKINPAFCEMTGLKKEATEGRLISEIMPDSYKEWVEIYGRVVMTGEPARFERFSKGLNKYFSVAAFRNLPGQFTTVFTDITATKKAEQELERQKVLLDLAGRLSHFGGWDVDLSTNISHWSDEVAAIHEEPAGFSPPVEKGISYYAPEWRKRITEVFTACAKDGVTYDEEMEIITAKGNRRWVRTVGQAERDPSGNIFRVYGSFQDITENKRASAAIKESEELFRTLFEAGSDAIFTHPILPDGSPGPFSQVNDVACVRLGYSREELLRMTPADIDAGGMDEKRAEAMAKLVRDGQVLFEMRHRARDGRVMPVEISLKRFEYRGQPHALAIARDITERQRLTEALSAQEIRFRELFENMNSPVAVYQPCEDGLDFRFISVNRALEKAESVARQDIIGKRVTEAFPGVQEFGLLEVFRRVDRTGVPEVFPVKKYEDKRISGWRENYIYRLPSGEVVALYNDLTEVKKAQAENQLLVETVKASLNEIHICDSETLRFRFMNKGALDNLGYSAEEIMRLHPSDINPSISNEATENLIRDLKNGGQKVFESEHRRKDGSTYPVEIHLQYVPASKAIMAVINDITDRKNREAELRIASTRLETHISNSPLAVIEFDPAFRITRWEGAAERIFGWTESEVLGKAITELRWVHEGDAERVAALSADMLAGHRKSNQHRNRNYRKDGAVLHCLWHNSAIYRKDGSLSSVFSLVMDETERVQAASERSLLSETLKASLNEVYIFDDRTLRFRFLNQGALKNTGYSAEEAGQLTPLDIKPEMPREEFERILERLRSGEDESAVFETLHRRKDGSTYPVEVHLQHEKASGVFFAVMNDITARKEWENALLRSETMLKKAQHLARLGNWELDIPTGGLSWSDEVYEILELDPKTFIPTYDSFISAIHPDDREIVERAFSKALQTRSGYEVSHRLLMKDGRVKHIRETGEAYYAGGKPVRAVGTVQDLTDIREAEAGMARLQAAIDQAAEMVIITDAEGVIQYVNPEFEKMTGYTREEAIGKTPSLLKSGEQDAGFYERMWETISSGRNWTGTMVNRRKDGSIYTEESTISPVFQGGEKPANFVAVKRDVTEQRRAADKLREREEFIKTVLDNMPIGVAVNTVEPAVKFEYMNDNFARLYRAGREALIKDFWSAAYEDAGDRARIREKVESDSASGEPSRMHWEEVQLRRDGETFYISAQNVPVPGTSMMISTVWDVTDRKRAVDALREEEERFRTLAESAPDAIFVYSEGIFTYANPACCRLLGAAAPGELTGKPFMERIAPEFRETITERMRERSKAGRPSPLMRQRYLRLDGAPVAVETTAVPVKYRGKDSHLFFVRDMTDRERMESELLKSQKIESLGLIAGGIAHDFNNLLTGITANLSLLLASPGRPAEETESLRESLSAARSAKGLTKQLLTFASGGSPVKREGDLRPALVEAVSLSARGSNCATTGQIDPDLSAVEFDDTQIRQVFVNLATNAVQAMPDGGTLSLKARNLPGDKPSVEIVLSDTGAGIPPNLIQRIFDPYFTTKEKGHGLGLAMVYKIIKDHGGDVTVTSMPGQGTSFRIVLPSTGRPPAKAKAPAAPDARKGRGRILLMDDEEIVQKAGRRVLESLGYTCDCANTGTEALAMWERAEKEGTPFVAAILDMTIPCGMGGAETAARLRASYPSARLLLSSGYSADADISEYRKLGFDGLVAKPYNYEELAEELARITEAR